MTAAVDLLAESYPSIAHARIAARDAGWRPLPLDGEWTAQVWTRGPAPRRCGHEVLHHIRLTAVGRGWCWSAINDTTGSPA